MSCSDEHKFTMKRSHSSEFPYPFMTAGKRAPEVGSPPSSAFFCRKITDRPAGVPSTTGAGLRQEHPRKSRFPLHRCSGDTQTITGSANAPSLSPSRMSGFDRFHCGIRGVSWGSSVSDFDESSVASKRFSNTEGCDLGNCGYCVRQQIDKHVSGYLNGEHRSGETVVQHVHRDFWGGVVGVLWTVANTVMAVWYYCKASEKALYDVSLWRWFLVGALLPPLVWVPDLLMTRIIVLVECLRPATQTSTRVLNLTGAKGDLTLLLQALAVQLLFHFNFEDVVVKRLPWPDTVTRIWMCLLLYFLANLVRKRCMRRVCRVTTTDPHHLMESRSHSPSLHRSASPPHGIHDPPVPMDIVSPVPRALTPSLTSPFATFQRGYCSDCDAHTSHNHNKPCRDSASTYTSKPSAESDDIAALVKSCPLPFTNSAAAEVEVESCPLGDYYASSPGSYPEMDPQVLHLISMANSSHCYKTGRFKVTAFDIPACLSDKDLCSRASSRITSKDSSSSDLSQPPALSSKSECRTFKMYRKGRFFVQSVVSGNLSAYNSPANEEAEDGEGASDEATVGSSVAPSAVPSCTSNVPSCCDYMLSPTGSVQGCGDAKVDALLSALAPPRQGSCLEAGVERNGSRGGAKPSNLSACTSPNSRPEVWLRRQYSSGRFNIEESVLQDQCNHHHPPPSCPPLCMPMWHTAPAAEPATHAAKCMATSSSAHELAVQQPGKESSRKVGRFTIRESAPCTPERGPKSPGAAPATSDPHKTPVQRSPTHNAIAYCQAASLTVSPCRVASAPSLQAVASGEGVQGSVRLQGRFRVVDHGLPPRP